MRFPENLQEENVIVLEMILLTLQMTVLKLYFRTSLLWNFEIFPIIHFPKDVIFLMFNQGRIIIHLPPAVVVCGYVML